MCFPALQLIRLTSSTNSCPIAGRQPVSNLLALKLSTRFLKPYQYPASGATLPRGVHRTLTPLAHFRSRFSVGVAIFRGGQRVLGAGRPCHSLLEFKRSARSLRELIPSGSSATRTKAVTIRERGVRPRLLRFGAHPTIGCDRIAVSYLGRIICVPGGNPSHHRRFAVA